MPPDALPATSPDPGIAGLEARYRDAAPLLSAWSPAIEAMVQHRSVRAYTAEPLPAGTLQAMLAAAQSASTSSNLQVWSVVAIEDQARRDRLAAMAGNQRHIAEAPLFLCWVADLSRAERLGQRGGRTMHGPRYLEAFLVAVVDAALAAQNAAVAAESLGLGTVYIGGMRNHPEEVAAELALPAGAFVVFGLCVGHIDPAAAPAVKPRLPQSAVLHRERYDAAAADAAIEGYDRTLQAFQAEQGMKAQGWTELVLGRLGEVKALSGRDRLRSALEKLGFPLM